MPPAVVLAFVWYLRYEIGGWRIVKHIAELKSCSPFQSLGTRPVQVNEQRIGVPPFSFYTIVIRHDSVLLEVRGKKPCRLVSFLQVILPDDFLLLPLVVGLAPGLPYHLLTPPYVPRLQPFADRGVGTEGRELGLSPVGCLFAFVQQL